MYSESQLKKKVGINSTKILIGFFAIIALATICLSGMLFETNTFGNYQVKQAAGSPNPFDAVGLKALYELSSSMSQQK